MPACFFGIRTINPIYFQISYIYYIYAYIFISRFDRIGIAGSMRTVGVQ